MLNEEGLRSYADVIARAATDPEFFATLAKNPVGELTAAGVEVPDNANIHVVRNTVTDFYLVVPESSLLEDEVLAASAGGGTAGSAGSVSTSSTLGTCFGSIGSAGTAGSAG